MRSRSPAVTPPVPSRLEVVGRRLESWRRTRSQRSPVPDALWRSAVEVAGEIGVSRTARILRLDYYSLKKRLEISGEMDPAREATEFVELVGPSAHGCCECSVELEHPDGARMRIYLKGPTAPDLAALSRTFWDGAP